MDRQVVYLGRSYPPQHLHRDALNERAPTIVAAQWQSLDWGLKEIGKISFGGIQRNYETVLRRVVEVVNNGYFEFL